MTEKISVQKLIEDVIAGKEITRAQMAAADWDALTDDSISQELWLNLQQWITDCDIRMKDARYANMKRERLIYFLEKSRGD